VFDDKYRNQELHIEFSTSSTRDILCVRLVDVAPVTASIQDDGELSENNKTANGSGYLLGTLHSQSNVYHFQWRQKPKTFLFFNILVNISKFFYSMSFSQL